MHRFFGLLSLASFAIGCAACAINPVTGDRELALISEDQELAMGRQAAGQVEQSIGFVDDAELQEYVQSVGTRLATDSERPELPWQFRVVDDATPNAFALPGGYIYVTRGLMSLMSSEAELAAVLGHEIGHVTARHSVNQISRAQLAQLGLGLGMILSPELQQLGSLANTGLGLLFLKYGRDDERQADELGFQYMLRENYDVAEMDDVFSALEASGKLAGSSPVPTWLASHPSEPDRIAAARSRVEALPAPQSGPTVNDAQYLSAIDGLVYGEDPRNGFFRGDAFYHPELAFQFKVPESWQRQNLPNAVVAASPRRDAALELTLVEGAPEAAAAQFFSQRGIARVASRADDANRLVSEFRAEAQNGVVAGYVAHIALGQATYQLITYAPGGAFAGHSPAFAEIIESFRALTDPEILGVQPPRLEIVRLEEAMTLREFAQKYPSEVSLEELAVLNRIADVDEMLEAERALKRVA